VLDEILNVVNEKRRVCEEKQWKFTTRNGDVVVIRDLLNNVVKWVKRFQEAGDVIVQYDPTHAALPWAGVRILLNVCKQVELFLRQLTVMSIRSR